MPTRADTKEAAAEAARFAVPPDIHTGDFVFQYLLDAQPGPDRDKVRALITEYYFYDGDRSAKQLDALIRQYHPEAASRRLGLLEFASGYGCVSRHLRRMDDRYDLVACDIHPQAIDFLREHLDVAGVLSRSRPAEFGVGRLFDVVFCLSFFSHMPDRTFGDWIEALFATLAPDGLLIFTTHGREAHNDTGHPVLDPDGYWFASGSEQKDIPPDEYGCMVATPFYVMERIARCPGAAVMFFQEAFWWSKQDLFIVRKVATDFRPRRAAATPRTPASLNSPELLHLRAELARLDQHAASDQADVRALRLAIEIIHRSTSWRVTAPLRALGTLLKRPQS